MIKINTQELKNIQGDKKSKALHNQTILDPLKSSISNFTDIIMNLSEYHAIHWILNNDMWIRNRSTLNTRTYKRGDIIIADLGFNNFGNEPSYIHTCIVLVNKHSSVLIVPCSSKQYGKNRSGIIDATPADGFAKNTGIQSFDFRWISKNRITFATKNKVSSRILNEMDNVLLSFAPSIKNRIKQLNMDNNN